jgi:hypothetical protein
MAQSIPSQLYYRFMVNSVYINDVLSHLLLVAFECMCQLPTFYNFGH